MPEYRRGILQEGRFGWTCRNGMSLTEGVFWARRNGGYNFYYSDVSVSETDFSHPIAACGNDIHQVSLSGIFEANKDYRIAVKTISGFGWESEEYKYIHVRTDENVDGREVPEPVSNLTSGIADESGAIQLEWDYYPPVGRVRPAVFKIYQLRGDAPDYEYFFADSVEYREAQLHYVWKAFHLSPYNVHRLVVRAETADGVDDGNGRYVIARGNGTSPGIVDSVVAETV